MTVGELRKVCGDNVYFVIDCISKKNHLEGINLTLGDFYDSAKVVKLQPLFESIFIICDF